MGNAALNKQNLRLLRWEYGHSSWISSLAVTSFKIRLVVVSIIFWTSGFGSGILNAVLVSMEKSDFIYIISAYSNFSGTQIKTKTA